MCAALFGVWPVALLQLESLDEPAVTGKFEADSSESSATFLFVPVVSTNRSTDTLSTCQGGLEGHLGEPTIAGKFEFSSTFLFAIVVSTDMSAATLDTGQWGSGGSLDEPAIAGKFEFSSTFPFALVVSACRCIDTLGTGQ